MDDLNEAKATYETEARAERVAKRQDYDELEASFEDPKAAEVHHRRCH